jgi:hypothetical protein
MITYFPPPFIYKSSSKRHLENKDELVELILDDYEKNKSKEHLFDYNQNFLNSSQYEDIILKPAQELILNLYNPQNPYKLSKSKPKNIRLKDLWWVLYDNGDYAENHHHGLFGISGVYFLELSDTNTTNFVIQNPYPIANFRPENRQDDLAYRIFEATDVKEGDILLFPSSMQHYVNPVKTRKISIAFNLEILY